MPFGTAVNVTVPLLFVFILTLSDVYPVGAVSDELLELKLTLYATVLALVPFFKFTVIVFDVALLVNVVSAFIVYVVLLVVLLPSFFSVAVLYPVVTPALT